jgi:Ca2+-binding EF-hand superfamily protein
MLLLQAAAPAPKAPAARPAASQQVTKATTQAGVRAQFDQMDANKDGWVDRAEVQRTRDANLAAMQKRRSDQVAAAFARLDTNKDNAISRQEFDGMFRQFQASADLPWLNMNDTNKDGRVSLAEATATALAAFDRRDTDRNGVISQQEARAQARPAQARPAQARPAQQPAAKAQGR